MSQALVELKGIKKYFPIRRGILRNATGFVRAVDGIDLQIFEGQNLGLVGESGCGKTTLARILIKLIKPDCGSVVFRGKDITKSPNSKQNFRKDIQMVFQDPFSSLDPRFRIFDILKEAAVLLKEKNKAKIKERITKIINSVGLSVDVLKRLPHEFSGGERQRIAIARAIFSNPRLLIFDEAVSSLDVLIQNRIIKLLSELKNEFNLTYIFISHNLRVIKKISQKIAVMYLGRIVELADRDEIFDNALHPYTKLLLKAAINFKIDKKYQEIFSSCAGCNFSNRCFIKNETCLKEAPVLKEISQGHFVACHLSGG